MSAGDAEARPRIGTWPGRRTRANPFSRILADGIECAGAQVVDVDDPWIARHERLDALLMHWPENVHWGTSGRFARPAHMARVLAALSWLRMRGIRIVWVVHNAQIAPRDRNAAWRVYADLLCRLTDGALTLSPSTAPQAIGSYPGLAGKPRDYFWHPAYPDEPRAHDRRAATRAGLGVPEGGRLAVQIGFISEYKGTGELIAAFRGLASPLDRLLVAGMPYGERVADAMRRAAADDARILLDFRLLSPEDLADSTAAADLAVLAFNGHVHSGSLVHALSLGVPVLTSDQPYARDIMSIAGPDWVRLFALPLTPVVLEHALSQVRPAGRPDLTALAPVEAGRRILDFLRRLGMRR